MNFGQNELWSEIQNELCFRDIHFKKNIKIVIQLVENFQLWKILTVKGKIVWT